jgi:hypothetical protein
VGQKRQGGCPGGSIKDGRRGILGSAPRRGVKGTNWRIFVERAKMDDLARKKGREEEVWFRKRFRAREGERFKLTRFTVWL